MRTGRPHYDKAWEALKEAHAACFNHHERGQVGMSHGPFSGVNIALGIIAELEDENAALRMMIEEYKSR